MLTTETAHILMFLDLSTILKCLLIVHVPVIKECLLLMFTTGTVIFCHVIFSTCLIIYKPLHIFLDSGTEVPNCSAAWLHQDDPCLKPVINS